jgi:DNA-binding transcriptional LysR family regulator
MSRYLREYLASHPQADVRLEYLHPHRVYEAVDQGQADLGLVSYPEESASLVALPWRIESMVLVCHPQHSFARRRSVNLDALRGESFVAFQAGLKIREEIDRALAVHRVSARVALEFDNIETIKRAIEINAGVSLLPEPTITREIETGTLVQIPLEGQPLVRPLGIIHRRDRNLSEAARQFIELLQVEAARFVPAGSLATADAASNGDESERLLNRTKIAG